MLPARAWINHAIGTIYGHRNDCIGHHSDKAGDFVSNSFFMVIKLGAARRFEFKLATRGDDGKLLPAEKRTTIFRKSLEPGTAIIVGTDANEELTHSVPAMRAACGASGSLTMRPILTRVPWADCDVKYQRALLDRAERAEA